MLMANLCRRYSEGRGEGVQGRRVGIGEGVLETATLEQRSEASEERVMGMCREKLVPGRKHSSCTLKGEHVRRLGHFYGTPYLLLVTFFLVIAFPQFIFMYLLDNSLSSSNKLSARCSDLSLSLTPELVV